MQNDNQLNSQKINLSVIIPVFNEEAVISSVIDNLISEIKKININYEVIVVNDGSTDNSKKILLDTSEIKLINHPYNKGYGASLKTGIKNAKYDWVLFFDADGQHNPEYIKDFLEYTDEYDLIAGDRSNGKYVRPAIRKPGLWLLKIIANYLVDYKIPDLNCGFRLIKKSEIKKYMHLMPDGFSFSTTSTMAFLKDKKNVKFVPIEIERRNAATRSTVKPHHALTTFMLLFRLIMIFSPLRIFLPTAFLFFLIGIGFLNYDIFFQNISETTVFFLISSLIFFFFGLIADQIACIRREINKQNE